MRRRTVPFLIRIGVLLWGLASAGISRAADPASAAPAGSTSPPVLDIDPGSSTRAEREATTKKKKKKKSKKDRKKTRKKTRKKRKPVADRWHFRPALGVHAGGGLLVGRTVRRDRTPMVVAGAVGGPAWERKQWQVALPLGINHRETTGADLRETRGKAFSELSYSPVRELRLTGAGGVRATYRPGWQDLYQPIPDDGFVPTDRYSYWTRELGAQVRAHPIRRHWLTAQYRYRLSIYVHDPHFDPYNHPTHLVPGDHERHDAWLGWRYGIRAVKVELGAQAFTRDSFFMFARDAGTGRTHAGSGGAPPNPLKSLRGIEPAAELATQHDEGRIRLNLRYGHEIVQDTHQGYYSFMGPHPQVRTRWRPSDVLYLDAGWEAWWRRYGPDSYAETPSHPPLDSGDRRVDHRMEVSLEAHARLRGSLFLYAENVYRFRRTNFPDYVPGEFPRTRSYDIQWDYHNYRFTLGVEWALDD